MLLFGTSFCERKTWILNQDSAFHIVIFFTSSDSFKQNITSKTLCFFRFRGVREGTITENTSYYIFTQCADGAFEAFPVEEWYNFSPMIRYKYLNSEEAEEEFSRLANASVCMDGTFQVTARFLDSDVFCKAINVALRCIFSVNSHLTGFKLKLYCVLKC